MQTLKYDFSSVLHVPGLDGTRAVRNRVDSHAILSTRHSEREEVGQIVYLIDGDPRELEAVSALLISRHMKVICFPSAEAYLRHPSSDVSECLILNIDLPDINGLELQQRLTARVHPPIIFMSAQEDIASAVRAIKAGAVDFLTKPIDQEILIRAIQTAIAQDLKQRQKTADLTKLQLHFSSLTSREREVLSLLIAGLLNKQIGALLGIATGTVQLYRGQIMRKMAAGSFADLVRMAVKLRVPHHWEYSGL
jgi:FixJ family two-component response regulator